MKKLTIVSAVSVFILTSLAAVAEADSLADRRSDKEESHIEAKGYYSGKYVYRRGEVVNLSGDNNLEASHKAYFSGKYEFRKGEVIELSH